MRSTTIITLIALTALSTAAFGGAVSGVSNSFAIDNTKGAPLPVPSTGWSPYGSGTVLLRGQLHAHRISDYSWAGSEKTPDELAYLYRDELGYDFLAQTEHHNKSGGLSPLALNTPWIGWIPRSAEMTYNEAHVLAVGCVGATSVSDLEVPSTGNKIVDTINRVQKIHQHGGLAFVAHPDTKPWALSPLEIEVIARQGVEGVGIYTPGNDSQGKWDHAMTRLGRPIWGYVEDDYHPQWVTDNNRGKTWVAVPGQTGDNWVSVTDKLADGNYFSYWLDKERWSKTEPLPRMTISVTPEGVAPTVYVTLSNITQSSKNRLQFIGKNGRELKQVDNPGNATYDYPCNGYEGYVRVRLLLHYGSQKMTVAGQPIRIWKTGAYSSYNTTDLRAASTSEGLILTYLRDSELPAPPAAGYIGDAFDVSTIDGLLPPSATLQLSFEGDDLGPLGGTAYLAIYHFNESIQEWEKVGGVVDPGTQTIESPISSLGKYCISADLPEDITAPEVFIDNPPHAASVPVDTTVRATVNDDIGAWRVRFFLNDHLLAEDACGEDGWTADITVSDYCAGDWTLKAVAEDLAGNMGSAEMPIYIVSSTPRPSVTIDSPIAGSVLTGTATASGTCGDDVAVAAVTLKLNGTVVGYAEVDNGAWTCRFDTSYLADGNRSLVATVTDYPGNEASADVPVVINNNQPVGTLGDARNAPSGTTVCFSNAIVVATVSDGFYAESTDRACGVKVLGGAADVGDAVSVVGAVDVVNNEKVVLATDVLTLSTGNPLPRPLGMRIRHLTGSKPDSTGKIVRVWGRVGQVDASNPAKWFTLLDVSEAELTCRLPEAVSFDPDWSMVAVTGVAATEPSLPVILVTDVSCLVTP